MRDWPWIYLFTAAQTELGKSEEWFWNVTPRVLITMLNEKKKLEIEKMKVMAYLMQGGTLNENGQSSDEYDAQGFDPLA